MNQPRIDRQTAIRIAAAAGVDPRTAAKYALSDARERIGTKAGARTVRAAVHQAARQLGVRR